MAREAHLEYCEMCFTVSLVDQMKVILHCQFPAQVTGSQAMLAKCAAMSRLLYWVATERIYDFVRIPRIPHPAA